MEKKKTKKKVQRILMVDDCEFYGAIADELLLFYRGTVIPPDESYIVRV